MKNKDDILQAYGTTWAGDGSAQLPTPSPQYTPGLELHALRDRRPEQQHGARAQLGSRLQLAELRAAEAGAVSYGRRLLVDAAPVSRAPLQADYAPYFVFRGGRTGNAGQYQTDRGPFTNQNVTHDVIANLTKVWGAHSSKVGFYFQHSFKPQSIFASLQQPDRFHGQLEQPVRHGAQLRERRHGCVQFLSAGLEVRAARMALQEHRVVRAGQLEAQRAGSRSITACGSTT